jgi:UDP-N-acetylglucosamine 2-epimerase (non-hydrolysing)
MSGSFFKELGLPKPKYLIRQWGLKNKEIPTQLKIEEILSKEIPDFVFVQGDTDTARIAALATVCCAIPLCHVEAGLRSYEYTMPEEKNRFLIDHLSEMLFCPTKNQEKILRVEDCHGFISVTGNTVVDALKTFLPRAKKESKILKKLKLEKDGYFVFTCHRKSNDNYTHFLEMIVGLENICLRAGIKCIFPAHPRVKHMLPVVNKEIIRVIEPLGYLDNLALLNGSRMIFTDSGGIQEEACIMHKKCVILRLNTERPETLEVGGAVLLDEINHEDVLEKYIKLEKKKVKWSNPFGDGQTGKRILTNFK